MPETEDSAILLAVLSDLMAWLQAGEAPRVVIGGLAASLLGHPRLTRDVGVFVHPISICGSYPQLIGF